MAYWEVTQKLLQTETCIVRKPRLTETLLKKPPFRFLHDVISEVKITTNFVLFSTKSKKLQLVESHVKNDLSCNCHVLIIYNTMRLWDLEAGGVEGEIWRCWYVICNMCRHVDKLDSQKDYSVPRSFCQPTSRYIATIATMMMFQFLLQIGTPENRLQVFSIFSKAKWCTRKRILELKNASNVIKDWSLGCTYDILHTLESVWHMTTCGFCIQDKESKVKYLWKIINCVGITLNASVPARPLKVPVSPFEHQYLF